MEEKRSEASVASIPSMEVTSLPPYNAKIVSNIFVHLSMRFLPLSITRLPRLFVSLMLDGNLKTEAFSCSIFHTCVILSTQGCLMLHASYAIFLF